MPLQEGRDGCSKVRQRRRGLVEFSAAIEAQVTALTHWEEAEEESWHGGGDGGPTYGLFSLLYALHRCDYQMLLTRHIWRVFAAARSIGRAYASLCGALRDGGEKKVASVARVHHLTLSFDFYSIYWIFITHSSSEPPRFNVLLRPSIPPLRRLRRCGHPVKNFLSTSGLCAAVIYHFSWCTSVLCTSPKNRTLFKRHAANLPVGWFLSRPVTRVD